MQTSSPLTTSSWPADRSQSLLDLTLGALLRQVADEVPERIAVVEGVSDPGLRRRWTYANLLRDAERVARALLTRFTVGERVVVYASNSPEWVLLQYGMSFAGLILVPVNPAYTARELEFVARNCDAAGIIFESAYRGRNLRDVVDERRGAPLQQRGVINPARNIALRMRFPAGGIHINAMPMFHIAGSAVAEMGVLALRGTFVLMPHFDAGLMLELFGAERGNATLIVPTMILSLLDHPDRPRRDVSSLQTILSGAANVPAALVRR